VETSSTPADRAERAAARSTSHPVGLPQYHGNLRDLRNGRHGRQHVGVDGQQSTSCNILRRLIRQPANQEKYILLRQLRRPPPDARADAQTLTYPRPSGNPRRLSMSTTKIRPHKAVAIPTTIRQATGPPTFPTAPAVPGNIIPSDRINPLLEPP